MAEREVYNISFIIVDFSENPEPYVIIPTNHLDELNFWTGKKG